MATSEKTQISEAQFPETVSTQELAQFLGIPKRTISHWKAEGTISPIRHGTWEFGETTRQIIQHLRMTNPAGNARQEYLTAQARLKEHQLASVERETIPTSEAILSTRAVVAEFVQAMQSLPSHAAAKVAASSNIAECRALLKQECNLVRNAVAERLQQTIAKLSEPEPRSRRRRS